MVPLFGPHLSLWFRVLSAYLFHPGRDHIVAPTTVMGRLIRGWAAHPCWRRIRVRPLEKALFLALRDWDEVWSVRSVDSARGGVLGNERPHVEVEKRGGRACHWYLRYFMRSMV